MKLSEINVATRYVWECPNCGHYNEDVENPAYATSVICSECTERFELKDD